MKVISVREESPILDQARLGIIRILAQLEDYSGHPSAPAQTEGLNATEWCECQARVEAAAAASRRLLLDIQTTLDTVQGTSSGPGLSAGGSSNHGRT